MEAERKRASESKTRGGYYTVLRADNITVTPHSLPAETEAATTSAEGVGQQSHVETIPSTGFTYASIHDDTNKREKPCNLCGGSGNAEISIQSRHCRCFHRSLKWAGFIKKLVYYK